MEQALRRVQAQARSAQHLLSASLRRRDAGTRFGGCELLVFRRGAMPKGATSLETSARAACWETQGKGSRQITSPAGPSTTPARRRRGPSTLFFCMDTLGVFGCFWQSRVVWPLGSPARPLVRSLSMWCVCMDAGWAGGDHPKLQEPGQAKHDNGA